MALDDLPEDVRETIRGEIAKGNRVEQSLSRHAESLAPGAWQDLTVKVLAALNRTTSATVAISEILLLVQETAGVEAAGIRLAEGEDFPYYETRGFSAHFVEAETYLCSRDQTGQIPRDSTGNPQIECMCGNVICGRTDPTLPFFTHGGSFCTGSTTELLATTTEEDRQSRTRNRCNGEGYESVALVPLRSGKRTIGLLQLNDKRRDMFTPGFLAFLEGLGASIGICFERKRAEEALRESEERFRSFMESANEICALFDSELNYMAINEAALRLFPPGTKREDVVGRNILDIVPTLRHTGRYDDYLKVIETGEPFSADDVVPHPKFGDVYLNIRAFRVCAGLGMIVQDITDRKRAEEALRDREIWLRSIFGSLNEALFVVTPDRHFVDANAAAERMFGYSKDELSTLSTEAIHVDHQHYLDFGMRIQEPFNRGVAANFEFELKRKNGEVFPSEHTVSLLRDDEGKALGIVSVIRDITERKRTVQERQALERQLLHAQKLESLGVLAGGVAHDFNNLLVGMLGHSDLALRKLAPENPARSHIEGVMQAAERAADLCRQMLAYSGHGHFIVQTTDLSTLVRENVHLLKAGIAKGVQLRTDLCESPTYIKTDVGQMQQVIMNLVINGAEAIGDRSGYVTISTGSETLPSDDKRYSRFTATELTAGRYVFLEVRDDGAGMDEEAISKAFDPFFTTKFVGRGLGLSALLGIVRGHKGGIDVQSEPGKGTTFRLVFPATEEAPEDKKVVATEGSLEGTILVIDDEEIVRDMAREMLTPQGLTVLTADGGAVGVALYKKRHAEIGLILLDFSMPKKGGVETFKELRKVNPDVPVLLSSGFGQKEATQRFEGLGLAGFIQKPYRLVTLLAEVRRCLGKAPRYLEGSKNSTEL